tara:strand:- start:1233 stop:1913 length:681 start_codon:yes stop_codon:yes gene_type:complete
MRKIILDTETTGLNFTNDRIIEVGCLELHNDIPTGSSFHRYYSPGFIKITEEAEKIHGLNNITLEKYPKFDDSLEEFRNYIKDSILIVHNASFDISMINSAFARNNIELINVDKCICSLVMAKKLFPGSKVNLNALCKRYDISIIGREKHDAMTDCHLLAKVYLELIGGKQRKFKFSEKTLIMNLSDNNGSNENYKRLPEIKLMESEKKNHSNMLREIPKNLWSYN